MLYYFKEQKKVTTANILSILRGALNYPLEESCYREHIRVHDISFLSSERVFHEDEIAGLEIKYSKLTMDQCLSGSNDITDQQGTSRHHRQLAVFNLKTGNLIFMEHTLTGKVVS